MLIGRRKTNQALGGFWEFPGGKLENNESLVECLRREIQEELGVNADICNEIFAKFNYEYDGREIERVALFAKINQNSVTSTAHDLLSWVKFDDLLNYKLVPSDVSIAQKLIDYYK